jgi:hypothetical protein
MSAKLNLLDGDGNGMDYGGIDMMEWLGNERRRPGSDQDLTGAVDTMEAISILGAPKQTCCLQKLD